MDLSKKRQYEQKEKLQRQIEDVLREEIKLRQKLLHDLSEKEYLFLTGEMDENTLFQKEEELAQLKELGRERNFCLTKLKEVIAPDKSHLPIEEILMPTSEGDCETLALYETLQTLIQKMQKQHQRIKVVLQMMKRGDLSPPQDVLQKETKPSLIILDEQSE